MWYRTFCREKCFPIHTPAASPRCTLRGFFHARTKPRKPQMRARSRHSRASTTTGQAQVTPAPRDGRTPETHATQRLSVPESPAGLRDPMKGTHMGSLAKTAPLATIARCSIIARAEDAADEAAIRQSMADPTISGKKIAAWIGCASSTVGEHRRIKCDDCCGGAA